MNPGGRTIRLAPPRRVTLDMLRLARRIPTVPVQKQIQIADVVQARRRTAHRPSWTAIFLRAFALTSMEIPALRRVYVGGWRPRLFESDFTVAMIAVEREYQGEPVVFVGRIQRPERESIESIDSEIHDLRTSPISENGQFRRTVLLGRLPQFLRRWILWRRTTGDGARRVRRSGTFGVSVYSALGAESLHPLAPVSCLLNYGVIADDGQVTLRVVYDHRVLDGAVLARALTRFEAIMNGRIVEEIEHRERDNAKGLDPPSFRQAVESTGHRPNDNHWFSEECARAFWDQKEGRPYRQLVSDTIEWARPIAGEHWLDLGCGSGELSKALWLESNGRLGRLICMDCAEINREPIGSLARKFAPGSADELFRFQCDDFSKGLASFQTGSLDGVVSGLSISYAESRDPNTGSFTDEAFCRLLAEVRRILKPSGRFVFSINVPNPQFWRVAWESLGRGLRISKPIRQIQNTWRMLQYGRWLRQQAGVGRFHYLSSERLGERLRNAGFQSTEHRLSYAKQAYVVRALPTAVEAIGQKGTKGHRAA